MHLVAVARRRPSPERCDGTVRALRDLVAALKRQLQLLNTGHRFMDACAPYVGLAFIQQATSINSSILHMCILLILESCDKHSCRKPYKQYVYMPDKRERDIDSQHVLDNFEALKRSFIGSGNTEYI